MSAHSVPSSLVEVRKEPITYLRGRSIRAAFIVVDEAQNLTRKMIKTIITRAGEGSKVVLLGDLEQIDSSHGGLSPNANGLAVTIERFRTQELSGHITLKEGMRSPLASMAALLL
jgi:PhoH-like ATPase